MKPKKIIGILGGMGPQASAEFTRLLVAKATRFGAHDNESYPEILLDSVPVPDFISDTVNKDKAQAMLIDRVQRLSRYPVDMLCIACNTAHLMLPELKKHTTVPFISVIEEVHRIIREKKFKRIGLLASVTTFKTDLYKKSGTNYELIYPQERDQYELEGFIRGVIGGEQREVVMSKAQPLIHRFFAHNSLNSVVLGCTEIPLFFPPHMEIPVINTLEVLSDAVLQQYYR